MVRADRVRKVFAAGVLLALGFATAPANADDTQANPLIASIGKSVWAERIDISFPDQAFPDSLDAASAKYVAQTLPAEKKQAFEAFVSSLAISDATYAERFSEYLAHENLTARLAQTSADTRRIKLTLAVEDVKFKGLMSAFSPVGSKFPSLGATFTIRDGVTEDVLATGKISRCTSWKEHIDEAKNRNGLTFNWSGSDTDFRVMSGMTDALAYCVERLLKSERFPVGKAQIGSTMITSPLFLIVPIKINEPIFEISIPARTAPAAP